MKRSPSVHIFVLLALCFLCFLCPKNGFSQTNYGLLKSSIIIQFGRHITWPDGKSINEYKIGIAGNDTSTFSRLTSLKSKTNINGKPFTVRWIRNMEDINGLQILYVDKIESSNLGKYSKVIENNNILLISEQSTDTKNIMLNFLPNESTNKLKFEVNKANIIIEDLEMNPELLLLGGTEVDVRELYREIKEQFEKERIQADMQRELVVEQQQDIRNQKNMIAINDFEIKELKRNTHELTSKILSKEKALWELSNNVQQQRQIMSSQSQSLSLQKGVLNDQEIKLAERMELIKMRSDELDSLINEGEKQRETIIHQKSTLESKEQIIGLQKKVIFIVVAFIIILAILSFIIFKFYKTRRTLSSKLESSNTTLREQHHSILQLNEELNTINEMLEKKVQERTSVLEERNDQLTEYAFINSHLLRAPLSQILGLSYLLTKEELPVKDQKVVDSLSKSTKDLDKIIRKISDLLYDGKDFDRKEIEAIINRKFNEQTGNNYRDN